MIMKKFQFPHKLVNLVLISIMETFVRVRVGNTLADPITVNSGLRYDDSLSPILFNMVLEKVIKEMNIGPQKDIVLQDTSIGLLVYADDILFLEETQ